MATKSVCIPVDSERGILYVRVFEGSHECLAPEEIAVSGETDPFTPLWDADIARALNEWYGVAA